MSEVIENSEKTINADKLERLKKIRENNIQIRNTIGDIELRKQELFIQYINGKQQMEKEAEAALLECGIDPKDIKEYRIDLKTGGFTK